METPNSNSYLKRYSEKVWTITNSNLQDTVFQYIDFFAVLHRKHFSVKIMMNVPPLIYNFLHLASNGQILLQTGTFSLTFSPHFVKKYPSIVRTAWRCNLVDFEFLVRR